MEVEDTENRQRFEPRHGPQAGQQLAFHVVDRLGHHGAMQREVDRVDAVPHRRLDTRQNIRPECFQNLVRHAARGGRGVGTGGHDFPTFTVGDLDEPVDLRSVSAPIQNLVAALHAKIGKARQTGYEAMRLVKNANEQDFQ